MLFAPGRRASRCMEYALSVVAAGLVWLLSALPVSAAEVGRYQVVPGTVAGTPTILLDTATGKTWRLDGEGKWAVMSFAGVASASAPVKSGAVLKKVRQPPAPVGARLRMSKPGQEKPKAPSKVKTDLQKLLKPLTEQ